MFALISLVAAAAPLLNLDELAIGEWSVQVSEFASETPEDVVGTYYTAIITPSESDHHPLKGDVFKKEEGHAPAFIGSVELVFAGSQVTVSFAEGEGQELTEIAVMNIQESQRGMRIASGNLTIPGYTYVLSILSDRAVELTVMDREMRRFSVYRMVRAARQNPTCRPCIFMQFMPIIMLVYMFLGNRKRPEPEPKREEEKKNEGNEENEKEEEHKKTE